MLNIMFFSDGDDEGRLEIIGKLDVNSAKDMEKAIASAMEKCKNITIDMKKLEYVSSTGLRVLQQGYLWAKAKGGKFKLKNVNENVNSILETTGMTRFIEVIEGNISND